MSISLGLLDSAVAYGRVAEYADGEMIHARGDQRPGLSIVFEGQVKVGNYGLDGQYQLTTILEKADTFGEFTLFANLPRTHNAEALNTTKVIQMTVMQYHRFVAAHPDVEKMLLQSLARQLHQALEILDDTRRLPTHARLAKMLYLFSQQQQSTRLQINQKQCAQQLGVTVLSAHKALKKLKHAGLINTAYGVITIIEIPVLYRWLQAQSSILMVDPRAC